MFSQRGHNPSQNWSTVPQASCSFVLIHTWPVADFADVGPAVTPEHLTGPNWSPSSTSERQLFMFDLDSLFFSVSLPLSFSLCESD